MKLIVSVFLTVLLAADASAAPSCSYVLNIDNYAENPSGFLTVNGVRFECSELKIGEDFLNVCRNRNTKAGYDFLVSFDGGEANFWVYQGLNDGHRGAYCKGTAIVKDRK